MISDLLTDAGINGTWMAASITQFFGSENFLFNLVYPVIIFALIAFVLMMVWQLISDVVVRALNPSESSPSTPYLSGMSYGAGRGFASLKRPKPVSASSSASSFESSESSSSSSAGGDPWVDRQLVSSDAPQLPAYGEWVDVDGGGQVFDDGSSEASREPDDVEADYEVIE